MQAAAGQSLHCTLLEAVLKGWGRGVLPWEGRGEGLEEEHGEPGVKMSSGCCWKPVVLSLHSYMYMSVCVLTCSKPLCSFLQCISLHVLPGFMYMQ